jgi:putative transposase
MRDLIVLVVHLITATLRMVRPGGLRSVIAEERLIGTIRRECLDHVLFWTGPDLELKLLDFRNYYNKFRVHRSLQNQTPIPTKESKRVNLKRYTWHKHCRGLYQTPRAA